MYAYLYDAFVRERRYEALVNRIESRIAELGLQGKVERLTVLKNAREIVSDAKRKGVDTFVVVGDDSLVVKVLDILAKTNVTLGLIPVGPKQTIAELLGIPYGEAACDTLSKRIVKAVDLGRANAQHFLLSLRVPRPTVVLESDQGFSISASGPDDEIAITNFAPPTGGTTGGTRPISSIPDDGLLEAVVTPGSRRRFFGLGRARSVVSVFPLRRLTITCKDECLPLVADGEVIVKTPVSVEVVPRALRVIVGRNRLF